MIDVRTILEYYAVITLVSMPATVLVMISLYRKTNVFDRIDRLIDRMLGIKPAKTDKPGGAPAAPEGEQPKESLPAPSMTLTVGDVYYCHPFGAPLQEKEWRCDNEFVGVIEEGNLFHARHAGRTKILSTVKGQQFDNGNVEYELEVLPNDGWFANKLLGRLAAGAKMAEVMTLFANRQTSLRPGREDILQTNASKGEDGLLMQFKNGLFVRCLWLIRRKDELDTLEDALTERFESVALTQAPRWFTLWKTGEKNEEKDLVPLYAFTHHLNAGETLLGIGRTWREKEDIDEFLMNVGMCVRLFADLSPLTAKIQLTAKVERPEPRAPQASEAADPAAGENPANGTGAQDAQDPSRGGAVPFYGEDPSGLPEDELDGDIPPDHIGDEYDEDLNSDEARSSSEFDDYTEGEEI